MSAPRFFHCEECDTLVGWAVARSTGRSYLANWSHEYPNGARYPRGAHSKTCAAAKAAREERRAAEAAQRAAVRGVTVLHRWTNVYGEEFRAWAAEDQAAAGAHFNALLARLGL